MAEKYLLFSLDDEKSKKLGEVIANPTCKKIANLLAEKEMSEADIAEALKIPLSTTEYNLNKLLEAGIIEKSKSFFWSVKGRKIPTYKIANKLIVISPKKSNIYSKLKGLAPLVLSSAVFTAFIAWYQKAQMFASESQAVAKEAVLTATAPSAAQTAEAMQAVQGLQNWQIFLIGIWIIIAAFVIYSIAKKD